MPDKRDISRYLAESPLHGIKLNVGIYGDKVSEELTAAGEEAIISVRGKHRFVVVSIEQYNHLRECELEAALAETERDIAAGNTVQESIEDHVKRITSA